MRIGDGQSVASAMKDQAHPLRPLGDPKSFIARGMINFTYRELTDEDIARIAGTYHAWRGEDDAGDYPDIPGFCKRAALEEVRKDGHVLTPAATSGRNRRKTTASRSRRR